MMATGALVALLVIAASGIGADSATNLSAWRDGAPIPLTDVSRYHCADGAYPVIRCFDTAAELAAEIAAPSAPSSGQDAPAVIYYVTFYVDASYGGASFTTSQSIADLRVYGWNDMVSSFVSLNGGRPKWWRDIDYAGTAWQWAAGAAVAYVGDGANDQFSSVANEP